MRSRNPAPALGALTLVLAASLGGCAGPGIRPEAAGPAGDAGRRTTAVDPPPAAAGTTVTGSSAATTTTTTTTTAPPGGVTGEGPVPATSTTMGGVALPDGPIRERLVIHAVGDVGMSVEQNGRFLADGFEIAWNGLDGLFRRDDLTVVNLECAPSDRGAPLDKEWALRCDARSLPVMASFGVDVASMANNHAGDMGAGALVDGRAALEAAGLNPVGAGADLTEATRAALFDVGGWRVAVVGLATVGGGEGWFAGPSWPGVAHADRPTIESAVGAAAAAADLVVVTVHWGAEELPGPAPGEIERARWMIEAGADVIVGHHSHRLQPLEDLDGHPVFWSLGDFVWPVLENRSEETAVAEIVVEPDGRISARLIPAYIVSDGHPVLLAPPDHTLRALRPR